MVLLILKSNYLEVHDVGARRKQVLAVFPRVLANLLRDRFNDTLLYIMLTHP